MTWPPLPSHTMQLAGRACSRSAAWHAFSFAPARPSPYLHDSPHQDGVRRISTAVHFYQNRHLEAYASKPATRLTLRQLVFFGKSMNEERLIKSANYVRTELPIRIAHRLRDMQALPYVVVTQEGVAKVYELYLDAFDKFRRYPQIHTLEENNVFCEFVTNLLKDHKTVIPNLSLGLSLSSPYLLPDRLDSFMRRMLVSRVSRRVLAEHHNALTRQVNCGEEPHAGGNVGIISIALEVNECIERCAKYLQHRPYRLGEDLLSGPLSNAPWPKVIIDGHVKTKFAYIREHLEYIIFELLKNAFRATRLKHPTADVLPPVRATVVASDNNVCVRISDQGGGLLSPEIKTPSDLFSFSHVRNAARLEDARLGALRTVSSSTRGMTATVSEQVGGLQPDAHGEIPSDYASPNPTIGMGLPMSNIYATYFGGSLELVSLDGYGTDVFVRLPKLGTNLEGIEL